MNNHDPHHKLHAKALVALTRASKCLLYVLALSHVVDVVEKTTTNTHLAYAHSYDHTLAPNVDPLAEPTSKDDTAPPKNLQKTYKEKGFIRYYSDSPHSTPVIPNSSQDETSIPSWLEDTQASQKPSSHTQGDEAFMQAKIQSFLKNSSIIPVLISSKSKPTGRVSYEYRFQLNALPIYNYHIKAIKMPDDSISIVGTIPTSIYDPAHYAGATIDIHDSTEQALRDMLVEHMKNDDPNVDENQMTILSNTPCVLTLNEYFVPGICITYRYNYVFYKATFNHLGVATNARLTSHLCAVLRDIHTLNPNTTRQDFMVNVCSDRINTNALVNSSIVVGTNLGVCSENPVVLTATANRAASKKRFKGAIWHSLFQMAPKIRGVRDTILGKDLQNSELAFNSRVYTHSTPLASRQAHVFSYVNRMYDWFTSLGFSTDEGPIQLIMATEKTMEHEVFKKKAHGNAFYTGIFKSDTVAGNTNLSFHLIFYGLDNEKMQNTALDFDISAHELSHYIISHNITGNFETTTTKDGETITAPRRFTDNYPSAYHTFAIHEGLADYFTFAATNNSCLGETVCTDNGLNDNQNACIIYRNPACLRKAEPLSRYGEGKVYQTLRDGNHYHYLGQLVSGTLWKVRSGLSNDEEKKRFDKVILNALDYAPRHSVSFVDLISATLQSDNELEGKRFCNAIVQAADYYLLLNIEEKSTQERIQSLRNSCPSGGGTYGITQRLTEDFAKSYGASNVNATNTNTPKTYSILDTNSLECQSSETTVSQLTTEAGFGDEAGNLTKRKPIGAGGCNGSLRVFSKAQGATSPQSSWQHHTKEAKHNPAKTGWWLLLCLPFLVIRLLARILAKPLSKPLATTRTK